MTTALIVSGQKVEALRSLIQNNFIDIVSVENCAEARRCLSDRDFDLCIINTPLRDEPGIALARELSLGSATQVIVLVNANIFEEICHKTEDAGVLAVAKPISKAAFWHAMKISSAVHNKINKLKTENERLLTTIDDIRIINEAKYMLIAQGMTEKEAHRYLEKQAMDKRITKKAVALDVINSK